METMHLDLSDEDIRADRTLRNPDQSRQGSGRVMPRRN